MAKLTPNEQDVIRLARSLIRDAAMEWARDELAVSPEDVCAQLSELIGEEYNFETGTLAYDNIKKNLFEDTVLRKDYLGRLFLMNHPEKGWTSSSRLIPSEESLLATYNVWLGEWSEDKFSEYCPVIVIRRDPNETKAG